MTPFERRRLGSFSMDLSVLTSEFSWLMPSTNEYLVQIQRRDNMPLSEMELRSILANLSWAVEGEPCLAVLRRV